MVGGAPRKQMRPLYQFGFLQRGDRDVLTFAP
jgi:hypothetical protein